MCLIHGPFSADNASLLAKTFWMQDFFVEL